MCVGGEEPDPGASSFTARRRSFDDGNEERRPGSPANPPLAHLLVVSYG